MIDSSKPKWLQWVALTTTILAVCTALASLRASSYSTRVQLSTSDENNAWAYYQSKSIKQHTCETQRDLIDYWRAETRTPQGMAALDKVAQRLDQDIARYDKEKTEIKASAEKMMQVERLNKRHSAALNIAIMFLQIAIMLSSIAALFQLLSLWRIGLITGVIGIACTINGIFLFV